MISIVDPDLWFAQPTRSINITDWELTCHHILMTDYNRCPYHTSNNILYTHYMIFFKCVMLKYNNLFPFFCGCVGSWKCAHFNPRECEFRVPFYLIIMFPIFLRNKVLCDPLDFGNNDIIANAVRWICGRIPRLGGDIRCCRDALLPTHKRRCGGWWRTSPASPPRDTFRLIFSDAKLYFSQK